MKNVHLVMVAAVMLMAVSCRKDDALEPASGYDRVFVMVSVGYNNLSSDLKANLKSMIGKAPNMDLPLKTDVGDAAVLVSRLSKTDTDYSTPAETYIVRISRDEAGTPQLDTLKILPSESCLTDKDILRGALQYVADSFPSQHYGMLYSSHGTGWLPVGYYYLSKSIGYENVGDFKHHTETDIVDFSSSIPMHLDYLLFDACFMGGVEVGYELRNVADKIGFSGTEILSGGFDYGKLMADVFPEGNQSAPDSVCRHYFDRYAKNGDDATVSLIDCSKLDALADVCRSLFSEYRDSMDNIDVSKVQGLFRENEHYYYDFADIMEKTGLGEEDRYDFYTALNNCVLYKANTPAFLEITIRTWCGLSMYLPAIGNAELDAYYKGLAWDKATGLIKDE